MDENEQAQTLENLIANYSKLTQLLFRIIHPGRVLEFPVNDFCAWTVPIAG